MCGIAGFVGRGEKEDLEKMIQAIKYRGPDDQGILLREGVGLAQARLAIIDLSPAGHQPMLDTSGSVAVIFNGEIYNFQSLRRELTDYHFISQTDTEVILAAYQRWGKNCFKHLDGMFAIALYDFKNRVLFLARDRFGKKPLYWTIQNGSLVFGSELKALLAHSQVERRLDLASLQAYLANDYIPTPQTIFQAVAKLEPASYLQYEQGRVKIESFWQPSLETINITYADAQDKLTALFREAVTKRLVSDVPLGVFLSGGLDSATIAYFAQRACAKPIQTFSIGFKEASYDESDYAVSIAKALGTEHHLMTVKADDARQLISKLPTLLDEPMADSSILPTHLLSLFTRQSVTVALSGDGGDELFGGYPTFPAEVAAKIYTRSPDIFRTVLKHVITSLPVNNRYMSLDYKLRAFMRGEMSQPAQRHARWLGTFMPEEQTDFLRPEVWQETSHCDPFLSLERRYAEATRAEDGNKLLYLYLRTYLLDQVLVKVDRASMATALEVRSPFLDQALFEFTQRLPYVYKVKGLIGKRILKDLMADKLPPEIVRRRKQGFALPVSRWLRYELTDLLSDLFTPTEIKSAGLFQYDKIAQLINEHRLGQADHRRKLWNLIVLQLWLKKWLCA